jgi:LysM repeat protein
LADLKGKLTHLAQQFEKARHENDVLRQRLRAINPRLAKVTPPPTPTGQQKSSVPKTKAPTRPPAPTSERRHKVKPRENPTSIARQYAIPVKRLMAANPGVDPRRMQVGQMLKIPSVQP